MDIDLPGYAWDLLPFKKEPLDLCQRQCGTQNMILKKNSYASLQTSLGCQFDAIFA